MLLYHFSGKDDLVATMLRESNDRSVAAIRALPPARTVKAAVRQLWRAVTSPAMDRCQRMYVEAAALGLLGREPYASVVREANAVWVAAVADHLAASGVPRARSARAARLLDAAFMGFQLDLPLGTDAAALGRAVEDLADALAAIASS